MFHSLFRRLAATLLVAIFAATINIDSAKALPALEHGELSQQRTAVSKPAGTPSLLRVYWPHASSSAMLSVLAATLAVATVIFRCFSALGAHKESYSDGMQHRILAEGGDPCSVSLPE